VDVVAHGDVGGGEAYHLPVAPNLLARAARTARHLVAGANILSHLDAATRILEDTAGRNLFLHDRDIVSGVSTTATSVIA